MKWRLRLILAAPRVRQALPCMVELAGAGELRRSLRVCGRRALKRCMHSDGGHV